MQKLKPMAGYACFHMVHQRLWPVEKVLCIRRRLGKLFFLIKWENFNSTHNSWEGEEAFYKMNQEIKDQKRTFELLEMNKHQLRNVVKRLCLKNRSLENQLTEAEDSRIQLSFLKK